MRASWQRHAATPFRLHGERADAYRFCLKATVRTTRLHRATAAARSRPPRSRLARGPPRLAHACLVRPWLIVITLGERRTEVSNGHLDVVSIVGVGFVADP